LFLGSKGEPLQVKGCHGSELQRMDCDKGYPVTKRWRAPRTPASWGARVNHINEGAAKQLPIKLSIANYLGKYNIVAILFISLLLQCFLATTQSPIPNNQASLLNCKLHLFDPKPTVTENSHRKTAKKLLVFIVCFSSACPQSQKGLFSSAASIQ
jgi:hypothetical protein